MPLILALEEAKKELDELIVRLSKEYNLPCYLLVPIVSDLLYRLEDGKRKEIEMARKQDEE